MAVYYITHMVVLIIRPFNYMTNCMVRWNNTVSRRILYTLILMYSVAGLFHNLYQRGIMSSALFVSIIAVL